MTRPNEFGFTAEAPDEGETERLAIPGGSDKAEENDGAAIVDETAASEAPRTLKRRGEKAASTESRKEAAVRNDSAQCSSSEHKKDT